MVNAVSNSSRKDIDKFNGSELQEYPLSASNKKLKKLKKLLK